MKPQKGRNKPRQAKQDRGRADIYRYRPRDKAKAETGHALRPK